MKSLIEIQEILTDLGLESIIVTEMTTQEAINCKEGQEFNATEWRQHILLNEKEGIRFFGCKDGHVHGLHPNGNITMVSPYTVSIYGLGMWAVEKRDNQMIITRKA